MNRKHAFTLVELLIALSITTLIGGTMVTLMMGVSQGTDSTQDGRKYFVRTQMLQNRLRDVIERSRCVLATTNTAIVLWFDEIPGTNGADYTPPNRLADRLEVNQNEIVLVEWDQASQQVRMYYSNNTPIDDQAGTAVDPGAGYPANWNSATYMAAVQNLKGKSTGLSQMEVIGTNVSAFSVSAFIPPVAPYYYVRTEPLDEATYVRAVATIGTAPQTSTAIIGAAMRQRVAPK